MKSIYVRTLEEAMALWPKQEVGKAQNFTGQKINAWTILYRTPGPRPMWIGKCECGNFGKLKAGAWSQKCNECLNRGRQKNYIGIKNNMLTVLEQEKRENGKTYLKCKCDCGNTTIVSASNFTSGEVKSCGCLSHQYHGELNDLTGKIFNDLTVLKLGFKKNGQRFWYCKCKCGNYKYVKTSDLTTNRIKSCGCKKYLPIRIGDTFGKLTVISQIKNRYAKNGTILYKCKCECGNEHIVNSSNLMRGVVRSCGCGRFLSYEEENINKLLQKLYLPFIREYTDETLNKIYPTHGRPLQYDFYINNQYIVEYDGSQHFYYRGTGWDTEEHFKKCREHDLIKNKFCFENNIPLIRIPYDADYIIDDLKLETTRFLLTPDNEEEYYSSRIKE